MGVEFVGRGCAKADQHLNREPGVFVVAAGVAITLVAPHDTSSADTPATYAAVTQASPDPAQQPTQVGLENHLDVKLPLDGFTLDAATLANSLLLPYLAMIASLIERRAIRCEELLQALLRSMRQRSFDRLPRREYVLRFLEQHPP